MFKFFRNFFKTKLGLAISLAFLGLIALAFASADVSGTGTFGGIAGGNRVAVVGKEKIGTADLVRAANNGLDSLRREQPTATMAAFLAQGGLSAALDALIERAAIKEFAQEHGFRSGDNLINSEIRMIPAFRGPDGNFSEDTYRQALAQQRVSDAEVREDLGIGLLSQQLLVPASFGASVPDKLAYRYAQLFKERREGAIGLLPAAVFAPTGKPEPGKLQAYYKANREEFVRPERRVIRYASFGSAALGDRIEPTDAEIAARYRENKSQYTASETRDFTQLIVPTQAAAQSIRERVAKGASFEKVAREAGLRAAPLADATREGIAGQASAAVAKAYFATGEGGLTEPARSPLGWHVARVDEVSTKPARSLAQVRDEIADSLREQKRARGLADLATDIEERLADGASLSEVAEDLKLDLSTTAPLLADGRLYDRPDQRAPEVLAPAIATAFQMDNEEPEIAPVDNGQTYLVYEVTDITPSATAPFDEIKEMVEARWRSAQGVKVAQAAADRVVERVRGGMTLAAALREEKQGVPPPQKVNMSREDLARQGERRVPAPLALLFSMAEGTTKKLKAGGNAGFFVVDVESIAMDDIAKDDPLVAQAKQQMASLLGEEYAEQLQVAMREAEGVERNPAAIEAVRKQLAGN